MSTLTNIGWCERTWGPVLGCSPVSEGCRHCYAILTCWRLAHNPNEKIARCYRGLVEKLPNGELRWTGQVNCIEERLDDPLHWKKPSRIFVNSQSDLFHKNVPFDFVDRVFATMALCPQHTFQILTKRPERMLEYFTHLQAAADAHAPQTANGHFTPSDVLNFRHLLAHPHFGQSFPNHPWPLPNVQLGVSVENQKTADERVPLLLSTPARVRFLSCEPEA